MQYSYSSELNITLSQAGDLINQVDINKLDEVEKLTISGDINGTDVLVIRKMTNLQKIDLSNANIVSGGVAYYEGNNTENDIIGSYMFSGLSKLEQIKTPQNVIAIYRSAFGGCINLKEFIFTDKIRSISADAFVNCQSITSITIPSNITTIGDYAFKGCGNLKEVTFSDSNNSITLVKPFVECPIETVYIGRDIGYNEFSSSPFFGSETLKEVTFNNNVTSLGFSFFYGCKALETIYLSNSIKAIGYSAFRECESLKAINLPDSLTQIYPYTFQDCSNLQEIKIPNSVKDIGNKAFAGCLSLASVTLPDSLTSIGDYAFSGCGLKSIDIPHKKTIQIGTRAFEGNSIIRLSIPPNVTSIRDLAFANCENLKELLLEDGESGLSLSISSFDTSMEAYSQFFNCPIEKLHIGRNLNVSRIWETSTLTNVSIGNKVTYLPQYLFEDCTGITQLSLPSSITEISPYVFLRCKSLKTIELPENLTKICNGVFYECESLIKIVIPASVTVIGGEAFRKCHNLTSVTSLNPTPPTISSDTFDEETEKNATLYVPIGSKNLYTISPHWENFFNIVETDLSSINGVQIDNNNTIQSVYSVNGWKLNVSDTSVLPKGVYVINGKKRLIK